MAFHQQVHDVYRRQSSQDVVLNSTTTRYDELSSSSADTAEWILFSPSMHDMGDLHQQESGSSDVLSTYEHSSELAESEGYDEDDDEDDASLLDTLESSSPLGLALPHHDGSGHFSFDNPVTGSSHNDDYSTSLTKNDFITNRIDSWRREQARILIDDLKRGTDTDISRTESNELMESWGVDNRTDIGAESQLNTPTDTDTELATETEETYSLENNKRFYGDDIFKGLTQWEVDKIKKVAMEMKSSLVRHDAHTCDFYKDGTPYRSRLSGRRLSILLNLSRATANKFLLDSMNQPFWKQDLSSAHSSLSLDTSSVMFGTLHLGDVI